MTTISALPALLATFVLSPFCSAQVQPPLAPAEPTPATSLTDTVGKYLESFHAMEQFSGAALVADDGKIVYQGAFGLANADWQIPNAVDTKFRLASVSKQFTAMLVLLLAQDLKLDLEAPITDFLPDYPAESGDEVTVHHLLNHTSGIPNYTNRPGFMDSDSLHAIPRREFVAKYCSDPLEFEPGSEFHYSNSGYYLLGVIAELVTGKSYAEALREHIFAPLGMNDTGYDDQYAVLPNRATGYEDLLGELHLAQWIDMSTPFAAGALYSTVGDLWKWDQALCSKKLLQGELEELMFTPGKGGYGYGWFIEEHGEGEQLISHNGGIPGFFTRIARLPERGRCVILLSNLSSSRVDALSDGILSLLDGKVPFAAVVPVGKILCRTVLEKGVDSGIAAFHDLPKAFSRLRLEQDINNFGYQMVSLERMEDALRLFEFNTRAFPEVANTWDSLGEAHAMLGNREMAIENYSKALELDPDSETAGPALEKLKAE